MAGLFFNSGIDKGYEKDLGRMKKKTKKFSKDVDTETKSIDKNFKNIGSTIKGLVAIGGFAAIAKELFDLTKATFRYRAEIQKLTKLQGNELNTFTANIIGSAKTFNKEVSELSLGVTNFAKGMQISFEEALTLIDEGFADGADASGEFLDQLREYSPLLKEAGLSAKEAINLMSIQVEQGIYSDKGIDTIKEANLRLREMPQATKDALNAIGISSDELQKSLESGSITTFKAIQKVSNKLAELPKQSAIVGTAIADIFGGPGEDAGLEFLLSLGKIQDATDEVNESLTETRKQENELLKVNKELQNSIANLIPSKNPIRQLEIAAKEAIISIARLFSSRIIKNIKEQRIEVNSLVIKLKDVNLKEGTREKILERLKILAPDIVQSIEDESTGLEGLNKILSVYNKQMALKVLQAEQDIKLQRQKSTAENFSDLLAERDAAILSNIVKSSEFLKKKIPAEAAAVDKILNDTTTDSFEKAQALSKRLFESSKGDIKAVFINNQLKKALTAFNSLKLQYDFEAKTLKEMIKESEELINQYEKILGVTGGDVSKIPDGESEKQSLARLEKNRKEREKKNEVARKKSLKNLEIKNLEIINELTKQFGGREDLEREFNDRLLDNQLDYLDKKHKLTIDALEKLAIEQAIINARIERDAPLTKLTSTFDQKRGEPKLRESFTDDKTVKDQESIISSFEDISDALATTGSDITNQIINLSTNTVSAFETLNTESSTTSDKISGIISLIQIAGELIKDIVTNAYTKESENLSDANNEIAKRIQSEEIINRLVRERVEMELNSSAFLDANYRDTYQLALQTLNDSKRIIDESLSALSGNLILTATGKGQSWLGINKTAEEYSFTLDQIINKSDTLSGVSTGGFLSNILDPADIFGGAASAKAYKDALNKVEKAFNSTLKSMGKTAGDMANFSSEQWTDFYTILDEGGFIVDQGTKNLVNGMREAQEQYQQALEEMKGVIQSIAGSLGNALGDALFDSIQNGTDALDSFKESLNDVFLEMAKAEVNSLFFQSLFDTLQEEMRLSMEGGDQNWQDDLLRFYDKLPDAISQSEQFLRDFDAQLQALGFEGISGGDGANKELSTAGQIRQSITEDTGTILAGHIGAMRLSNERIVNIEDDMLDLAVLNTVTLNQIKLNTDFLPEIAANTKKTAQSLGGF